MREPTELELSIWHREQLMQVNADLRARLELFREHVCEGCGCAAANGAYWCNDCYVLRPSIPNDMCGVDKDSAAISVGMRALCGRKVITWEVGEV